MENKEEPITITFEIKSPKTITESVINTIILALVDYKQQIENEKYLQKIDEFYVKNTNMIVNKIRQEVENLYIGG